MQGHIVLNALMGGAAAVTIISFLFFLANNYIVNKIGFMMAKEFAALMLALDEKFVTKSTFEAELRAMRKGIGD